MCLKGLYREHNNSKLISRIKRKAWVDKTGTTTKEGATVEDMVVAGKTKATAITMGAMDRITTTIIIIATTTKGPRTITISCTMMTILQQTDSSITKGASLD